MADGMYDSGGGDRDWYSDDHYGGSGGGGDISFGAFIALMVALLVFVLIMHSCKGARLEEERKLDRTVYHRQAARNFEAWLGRRSYTAVKTSIQIEPGSSHHAQGEDGDYHCKGIEFQTTDGRDRTVCCAVHSDARPICTALR